jgi:hypothetical protein
MLLTAISLVNQSKTLRRGSSGSSENEASLDAIGLEQSSIQAHVHPSERSMSEPPGDDAEVWDMRLSALDEACQILWTRLHCLQALGPELLDSTSIRKIIKVGTDVSAIATDAVTMLQYALVRWMLDLFCMC